MALRHVIELPQASIEVEGRTGYLFVVETGQLRSVREVEIYAREMEALIARSGVDKAVIDARGEIGDPPPEVREAMWEWLVAPDRGFTTIAFVLPSEMAVARVNMTALSRRVAIRAFDSVQQAQRWLMRGTRPTLSASDVPSSRTPSSHPPARRSHEALAPTERPPSAPNLPTTAHIPSAPPVPRHPARPARRPSSDDGLRRPQPGRSELAEGARTSLRAPADRPQRDSELRSRKASGKDGGENGGENGGGSRVA